MITAVSIVKDEADGLDRILPGIKEFADHVFVALDDRTTDHTEEILIKHEVEYGISHWVDFGTNRNLAIVSAIDSFPGTKWIMIFDGHEELSLLTEPENAKAFIGDVPQEYNGVAIMIERGDHKFEQCRFLRPHCRYDYAVHEVPNIPPERIRFYDGVRLIHHDEWRSASTKEFRNEQSGEWYIEKMLPLAESGNPRFVYHLAMAYHDHGDYQETIAWAQRYKGEFTSERFNCFAYGMKAAIEIGDWGMAIYFAEKEFFDRPDYYFLRAWAYHGAGRIRDAGFFYGLAQVTPMPTKILHMALAIKHEAYKENLRRLRREFLNRGDI